MAITVTHEISLGAGAPHQHIAVLKTWLEARDDRFTVIDSGLAGLTGAWVVFQEVGQDWELFIGGGAASGNPPYHADNYLDVPDDDDWHVAFAPGGGWAVGVDDPETGGGGTPRMFRDAPYGGTEGLPADWPGWHSLIEIVDAAVNTSAVDSYMTIIDDPATGLFALLLDTGKTSAWDAAILVAPYDVDANTEALDTYRHALMWGVPKVNAGAGHDLVHVTSGHPDDPTYRTGALLLPPAYDGAPVTRGRPWCDGAPDMQGALHPSPFFPAASTYQAARVRLSCETTGLQHHRGHISAAALRYAPDSLGARQLIGDSGEWISPLAGAQIVLPWDGSAV